MYFHLQIPDVVLKYIVYVACNVFLKHVRVHIQLCWSFISIDALTHFLLKFSLNNLHSFFVYLFFCFIKVKRLMIYKRVLISTWYHDIYNTPPVITQMTIGILWKRSDRIKWKHVHWLPSIPDFLNVISIFRFLSGIFRKFYDFEIKKVIIIRVMFVHKHVPPALHIKNIVFWPKGIKFYF